MKLREFFSQRLIAARKARKVTQSELAEAIGVGQATVSAWEAGKKSPRLDEIERMAGFFNEPVTYFCDHESKAERIVIKDHLSYHEAVIERLKDRLAELEQEES